MESPQHSDNDSTVVNDVNVEIEQMTRRKMSMFIQEDILIFTYDSMCVHAHMHRHTHTHPVCGICFPRQIPLRHMSYL